MYSDDITEGMVNGYLELFVTCGGIFAHNKLSFSSGDEQMPQWHLVLQ